MVFKDQGRKIIGICKYCSEKFIYYISHNSIFCSQGCYFKWSRGKNHPKHKEKTKVTCKQCRKEFMTYPAWLRKGRKFCSFKCRYEWLSEHGSGKINPNWRGGISFEPYSSDFSLMLKEKIKRRDGYVCKLCGKIKRLGIHHIDYNKKNNNSANLVTLCTVCNSRMNGNRESWKGFWSNKFWGGKNC